MRLLLAIAIRLLPSIIQLLVRPMLCPLGLGWDEFQGNAVDAVPFACWLWAIIKDMTQVATAAITMHLCARHKEAVIYLSRDGIWQRLIKARPTCATVKLRF